LAEAAKFLAKRQAAHLALRKAAAVADFLAEFDARSVAVARPAPAAKALLAKAPPAKAPKAKALPTRIAARRVNLTSWTALAAPMATAAADLAAKMLERHKRSEKTLAKVKAS